MHAVDFGVEITHPKAFCLRTPTAAAQYARPSLTLNNVNKFEHADKLFWQLLGNASTINCEKYGYNDYLVPKQSDTKETIDITCPLVLYPLNKHKASKFMDSSKV